jgi:hypothetical protein
MCASNSCGFYSELATDVFKTQNLALLKSVKDFLTDLPCSQSIEEILIEAFYQLAKIDPDACRWLLHNYIYLLPEVNLIEFFENGDRLILAKILGIHDYE